jgi:hypothetical protein
MFCLLAMSDLRSHNPEVAASNPAPATGKALEAGPFSLAPQFAGRSFCPTIARAGVPSLLQDLRIIASPAFVVLTRVVNLERRVGPPELRAGVH